ncbi:MAG TPA: glycosyltransferase family A protein [Mycobacteriales bacterium]|nr:glycosyltransferase family A protein [Mycobacteriales bacterium]
MSWLLVTPARNEADRLPALARTLARQRPGVVGLWVVVDDGSTDGTAESIPHDLPFPVHVLPRTNTGGLAGGSAFGAWMAGAHEGLRLLPDAERVLKLDADIQLADDYLDRLSRVPGDVGLIAGQMAGGRRERGRDGTTRGGLKAYNRAAFTAIQRMPIAVGFDTMDEVCIRQAGLEVRVVPEAKATVTRRTGASEGILQGHRRLGIVTRWTGYHPVYFAAKLLRYAGRKPLGIGAVVMLWSWLTAGRGPYPDDLRRAQRREQVEMMRAALTPWRRG